MKAWLKSLDQAALLDVVHALFERSAENRVFLIARFLEAQGRAPGKHRPPGEKELAPFKKRIEVAVYGKGGIPNRDPELGSAQRAIRDYREATGNLAGVLDLTLDLVEAGTAFTAEYGDIDEPYYEELSAMLDDLEKMLLSDEGREFYPHFRERLLDLRERSLNKIGWGYGDYVDEVVTRLEKAHEKGQKRGR